MTALTFPPPIVVVPVKIPNKADPIIRWILLWRQSVRGQLAARARGSANLETLFTQLRAAERAHAQELREEAARRRGPSKT